MRLDSDNYDTEKKIVRTTSRGTSRSFIGFVIRTIIVLLLLLLLIFIITKFLIPGIKNINKGNVKNKYNENINLVKTGALQYFTKDKLPKNKDEKVKVNLKDLEKNNNVSKLEDSTGKKLSGSKSYAEMTKLDEGYLLKVKVSGSDKESYQLYKVDNYEYCITAVCEAKKVENENIITDTTEKPIEEAKKEEKTKKEEPKEEKIETVNEVNEAAVLPDTKTDSKNVNKTYNYNNYVIKEYE